MAFIMPINPQPPFIGMNRILNVSQKVGDSLTCVNNRNDVQAVQGLIAIAAGTFAIQHGFPLPQPTGRFDPLTAYYIYHLQIRHRDRNRGAVVDGDVSSARGTAYGGGVWTIVNFNGICFLNNRPAWETLLATFPTSAS